MKQDRQQELHFEDLAKQFTEDVSRSKWVFSMEDAMQDSALRKSMQKHRRKMKRKTVLEYAIAFSAIAVGLPVLLWYLYRQFCCSGKCRRWCSSTCSVRFWAWQRFWAAACLHGHCVMRKIRACRKGVDIDSDDLQLILVTTAEYDKISALAEQAGHRIAPAETL